MCCWAQVDFGDKNTVLMLEIWQTFVDLSAASGAPCVAKLLRAPSCSVTPLSGLQNFAFDLEPILEKIGP